MERFQKELIGFIQGLYEGERKVLVFGEGPIGARVMMIGEAPGEQESLQGRPFVGKAGKNLDAFLQAAVGEVHGRFVDWNGRALYPMYHPASVIYNPALKEVYADDVARFAETLQKDCIK